ncbi:NAD-P-binding protein [Pseudohyphozyma bogoriensis]|nr:NAD-P-binding protein [Pseudohyphozyma bogoriensis]
MGFSKPQFDIPDLTGKLVLVTGANTGIGYQTAQQLALHGAKVYVGARTVEKATMAIQRMEEESPELSGKGRLRAFKVDLSTVCGTKEDAGEFLRVEERLDVLINNAGMGNAPLEIGGEGVAKEFSVNLPTSPTHNSHLGPFVLTQTLLPLLIKTSALPGSDVRVITVASKAHEFLNTDPKFESIDDFNARCAPTVEAGETFMGRQRRYGLGKLANILFARQLQTRLLASPIPGASSILSISLHPGAVGTDTAWNLMSFIGPLRYLLFVSPLRGAATSLFAATAVEVRKEEEKYRGKYLVPYGTVKEPSVYGRSEELAERLNQTMSAPPAQSTNVEPTAGNPAANTSGGGDALDKGVRAVVDKTGYGAKVTGANIEKASDGIRSLFHKATGKDVPIKDQEMR